MNNVFTWTIGLGIIALAGCHDFKITHAIEGGTIDVNGNLNIDDGHADNTLAPLMAAVETTLTTGQASYVPKSQTSSAISGPGLHTVTFVDDELCIHTDFTSDGMVPGVAEGDAYSWEFCTNDGMTGTLTAYNDAGGVPVDGSDWTYDMTIGDVLVIAHGDDTSFFEDGAITFGDIASRNPAIDRWVLTIEEDGSAEAKPGKNGEKAKKIFTAAGCILYHIICPLCPKLSGCSDVYL